MREKLPDPRRARRYQRDTAPRSTPRSASRSAARRRRNAGRNRDRVICIFMVVCTLLVCGACGAVLTANPTENPHSQPGNTDSASVQPENSATPPPEETPEASAQATEPPTQAPTPTPQPTENPTPTPQQTEITTQPPPETPPAVEYVLPFSDALNAQVQKVLDKIVTGDMTKLEQAKAVWTFTKNNISYTGDSNKTDWETGAYEGLATRRGDCFTYYAVSRALLTALGIDNLEVRRVGGRNSHYWNLVNCGDGWYHFDATPRSSRLPYFVSFMFTDEQAAEYTAKVGEGREYYTFDGSLYPERGA